MKLAVLYVRVLVRVNPSAPMHFPYDKAHTRFLETYKQFRPKTPHDLIVVNCGQHDSFTPFDDVVNTYLYYDGHGWDCGTYQAVVPALEYDLVLCLNTIAYFWRDGWLEPFAAAFEQHGPGVYGATGSYESHPHLRTPSIAVSPKLLREYPLLVTSRTACVQFESGPTNFTLWAENAGYPTMMVAADGVYKREDWRKPGNVFRRGDQSNCLIWDRHTLLWAEADTALKDRLTRAADGEHSMPAPQ